MNIAERKNHIRKEIKRLKKQLTSADKEVSASHVFLQLEQTSAFKGAKGILAYWSLDDELPTHHFIANWQSNKNFYLPKVCGDKVTVHRYEGVNSLAKGKFGIWEPTGTIIDSFKEIDLVIVPGIAFSHKKERLGRGGGYYDKLLPQLQHCLKAGVGFSFQLLDKIPSEVHDIAMDIIVTPEQIIA